MRKHDPYLGFNFAVALVDSASQIATALRGIETSADAGFSEVTGLETTLDVEDYQEGGNNGRVLKFPTRVTWANLRLKRGVGFSDELWNWYYGFVSGQGKRRDGVVALLNHERATVKAWQFSRGIPAKWTGPTFDALQNRVAIEELEIAHEGLELIPVEGNVLQEVAEWISTSVL